MALARIMPLPSVGHAGLDFVPARLPPAARWYMPWRYGRWRGTNAAPPRLAAGCAKSGCYIPLRHAYLHSFAGVSKGDDEWSR